MPSVYVQRGDRLRCLAVRGYWQILDGMPASAGIIGRTWRSGRESIVAEISASMDYLPAAPGIHGEICCPLYSGGACVGALNVEAQRPLTPEDIEETRHCAHMLSERIEALGGPPRESVAQRLVRHAARLAALEDVAAIEREAVAAALDLVDMDTAAILRATPEGLSTQVASGPLADVLLAASQETLRTIASHVEAGTSCYTVGELGEKMALGMDALRHAGAESVSVLGIGGAEQVLLLADCRPLMVNTDEIELLEMLCSHVASCLRSARALDELRQRAATDPLTGLGHHATFHRALADAPLGRGIAVAVIDVDGFKHLNDSLGHQAGDRTLRWIAAALNGSARRGDGVFRVGGDEFAAVLRARDDQEALEAGQRLRRAVLDSKANVTVSIGVALSGPGEDASRIIARADRALYVVKAAGRDGVALAEPDAMAASLMP